MRVRRFFVEAHDATVGPDLDHAKALGLLDRHLDAGHRDIGIAAHMVGQQAGVIHLVDVVAGQDQRISVLGQVGQVGQVVEAEVPAAGQVVMTGAVGRIGDAASPRNEATWGA